LKEEVLAYHLIRKVGLGIRILIQTHYEIIKSYCLKKSHTDGIHTKKESKLKA